MGLALCVTNVIGFTKSSKGAQHAARALLRLRLHRALTLPFDACACRAPEAKAEISAGVSRLATRYMVQSTFG
jgi:hypothetical protein